MVFSEDVLIRYLVVSLFRWMDLNYFDCVHCDWDSFEFVFSLTKSV